MTWETSGPNLVLLEESEPKYPKHPFNSILVYKLFLDRQRNILFTPQNLYTGILADFMK